MSDTKKQNHTAETILERLSYLKNHPKEAPAPYEEFREWAADLLLHPWRVLTVQGGRGFLLRLSYQRGLAHRTDDG